MSRPGAGTATNVGGAEGDGAVQIYGSAIDADPAELRSLALKIEAVMQTVSEAAGRIDAARQSIEATTPWAPTSGRHAQSEAHLAQLALLTSRRTADGLATDLREAAAAYETAEEQARQAFVLTVPRAGSSWGPLLGPTVRLLRVPMVIGAALAGGVSRGQWSPSAAQMGEMLHELSYFATGGPLYPDWAPMSQDRMRLTSTLASWALTATMAIPRGFTPHGVEVCRAQRSTDLTDPVPEPNPHGAQNIGGLMAGIGDLYAAEAVPEGTIRIDQVTSAEGEVSWQVYIPGTQTQLDDARTAWNIPLPGAPARAAKAAGVNEVPQDWLTNLQVYSGLPSSVENGVVQALDAAGVGADEPVLFTGHSQGAMIAMSAASDPRIQNNYQVDSVVTFGGPVGHMRVPPEVSVLNVEHTGDLVSGLENTPNPIEPNRFTATRDIAASTDPADAGVNSVAQSHDIPAYLRTAELIDGTDSPVLASWRSQSAAVMADDQSSVTSSYFTFRRERWYNNSVLKWVL